MISKCNKLKVIFITLGKVSSHIMALHFLVIKLIDICYVYFNGITDISIVSNFPSAFNLWYLYIILVSIIPILIVILLKNLNKNI